MYCRVLQGCYNDRCCHALHLCPLASARILLRSLCLWVLLAVPADSSPGHHLLLFWLHTCGSSSHNQAVFPLPFSSHSSPDGRRLWTVGMASWPLSKILLFYELSCPTCLTRVSLFPSSMLLSASVRTYLDLFSPFSSPQSQSIPLYSQSLSCLPCFVRLDPLPPPQIVTDVVYEVRHTPWPYAMSVGGT